MCFTPPGGAARRVRVAPPEQQLVQRHRVVGDDPPALNDAAGSPTGRGLVRRHRPAAAPRPQAQRLTHQQMTGGRVCRHVGAVDALVALHPPIRHLPRGVVYWISHSPSRRQLPFPSALQWFPVQIPKSAHGGRQTQTSTLSPEAQPCQAHRRPARTSRQPPCQAWRLCRGGGSCRRAEAAKALWRRRF